MTEEDIKNILSGSLERLPRAAEVREEIRKCLIKKRLLDSLYRLVAQKEERIYNLKQERVGE